MRETVWRRKVVLPIFEFLRQGLTPERLSFTIALGFTLGVTPVLGSTMLLCTLAALVVTHPTLLFARWLPGVRPEDDWRLRAFFRYLHTEALVFLSGEVPLEELLTRADFYWGFFPHT